jgi:hypothetical protein
MAALSNATMPPTTGNLPSRIGQQQQQPRAQQPVVGQLPQQRAQHPLAAQQLQQAPQPSCLPEPEAEVYLALHSEGYGS